MKKILCLVCAVMCLIAAGCTEKNNSKNISINDAEKIAFEHAGVSGSDVKQKKNELDYDNGRQIYEIDFKTDSSEYSYNIDAQTGEILKHEKENGIFSGNTDSSALNNDSGQAYISEDDAKNTAFKHAGVTDAERYGIKSDTDDGTEVYDIEFLSGGFEYEYEINRKTGEIIKFDKEKINR